MDAVSIVNWGESGAAPDALLGTGGSMRQVHIKAGHIAVRHSHPHEQFFRVLSGGGTLDCATGPVVLAPGTAVRFAPGAWHSAQFTSDTVLLEFNLAE